MGKATWVWAALGLVVAAGLPLAGKLLRCESFPRCALDGEEVGPIFRVRIVDAEGRSHLFCCLRCAELWQRRQLTQARAVYVTDEKSGGEVDLKSAYFVRSRVAVPTSTGNRVHVFARRADAEKHAATHGGRLLEPAETPFHETP
jgi:hypothetical protein